MRGADTEGHTGCDSTDGKRAEQADPQTQRVGPWLSGARVGMGVTADGDRTSFGRDGGMFWNEIVVIAAQ